MAKIFGQYISPEMCFLWILEFILSFVIIYTLSAPVHVGDTFWAAFDLQTANRAAIVAVTVGITAIALGLYRPEVCLETRRMLVTSTVAGIIAFPAVLLIGLGFHLDVGAIIGPDRFWPLKTLSAWIVMLFATRLIYSLASRMRLFVKRLVVVGGDVSAFARVREAIAGRGSNVYELAGTVIASPDELEWLTPAELRRQRIWSLVVTPDAHAMIPADRLAAYGRAGVKVFDDTEFRERHMRRLDIAAIQPGWLDASNSMRASAFEERMRRLGDIGMSLAFLVFTFPLMLVTAMLIRLDSKGPIFYRQERVGLHGKPFTLLKFRSMSADAELKSGPSWAAQRDPRVTRIGSFIRRTRIDELPQILNILRGEMCFIGPRPERPHFVESLSSVIPNYGDRALVKPGLTGWAQVNFPYGASVEDARMKLSYDLYYVRHRSAILDILILFATVRVILFQEGSR